MLELSKAKHQDTHFQRSNVDQLPIVEDISHYGEEVHIGVNEDDQVLEEGWDLMSEDSSEEESCSYYL